MAAILQICFVVLSIATILHGFPQKPQEKDKTNAILQKETVKRQNTPIQNKQQRKVRNVEEESADVSHISTFPATIDQLPDTNSNKSRENKEESTQSDRFKISTPPSDSEEKTNERQDSDEQRSTKQTTDGNSTENTAKIL